MKVNVLKTNMLYQEMLALPDSERGAFFDEKLLQPFTPLYELTGMSRNPQAVSCLALTGTDAQAQEMLDRLTAADAWKKAHQTVESAVKNLQMAEISMPDTLTLGIFLGDPAMLALSEGYTGVGSIPGFIQIMIAPDEQNLSRLASCIAHDFHHNVLFHNVTWSFMNVSLSQYLAVEGLAESFAAALYGDDLIGPWVTGVKDADLARTQTIIGENLDVEGFMEVRQYMFGSHPMVPGSETTGLPYCSGYAAGYHAIKAYLNKTGRTIADATKDFISGNDIIRLSGYFPD